MKPSTVLWTVLTVLVVLWLVGLVANIIGGAIHILLIAALLVGVYIFVSRRNSG